MKNKRLLLISFLLIACLALVACAGGNTDSGGASATEPAAGGGNTSGSNSGSGGGGNFDPANATSKEARAAVGYVYEGLVRVKDGNAVGALAESFTVSDDGLDYIFNLRSGVTFHDGSPLNADVVVSNFNRWFDAADANRGSGDFSTWASNFGGFKGEATADGKSKSIYDGIEKVNDLTVLVHLNTPDADFLTKMADPAFSIVSAGAFAGGDGGTGAYKISKATESNLTLEPFAGYWDAAAIPTAGMDVPLK